MFERKTMEQLVAKMVSWTRGTTSKLTDFRVGSKIRAIQESVAITLEEFYDNVYKALQTVISNAIYAVFDFEKLKAINATGEVTFSRGLPADQNYLIPAGTVVATKATSTLAPIKYTVTADTLLALGQPSVKAPVMCITAGNIGNVDANKITDFIIKPTGIDAVTNEVAYTTGRNEETDEEQKFRFQKYVASRTRGTKEAVEYGALTAYVVDTAGNIVERVYQAVAFEFIEGTDMRKGEIDVYIWNGFGEASEALKAQTKKVLYGYYDTNGNPIYGYKPGGVLTNVYTAPIRPTQISMVLTPEDWIKVEDLYTSVEAVIDTYFSTLKIGQEAIQTAVEAAVKGVAGVADIKLYFNDTMNNVIADKQEVVVVQKPITYL
jgi:uncharacterized phage protein gp47/JayE